jgi:hypothetical protein
MVIGLLMVVPANTAFCVWGLNQAVDRSNLAVKPDESEAHGNRQQDSEDPSWAGLDSGKTCGMHHAHLEDATQRRCDALCGVF